MHLFDALRSKIEGTIRLAILLVCAMITSIHLAESRAHAGGGGFDEQLQALFESAVPPSGIPAGLEYPGATIAAIGTTTAWQVASEPSELKYDVSLCTSDGIEDVEAHYEPIVEAFNPNRVDISDESSRCPATTIRLVLPAEESGFADEILTGNTAMVENLPESLLVPANEPYLVSITSSPNLKQLSLRFHTADPDLEPNAAITTILEAINASGTNGDTTVEDGDPVTLLYELDGLQMEIRAERTVDHAGTGELGTDLYYLMSESTAAGSSGPSPESGVATQASGGGDDVSTDGGGSSDGAVDGTAAGAESNNGGTSTTMYLLVGGVALIVLAGGGIALRARASVPAGSGAAQSVRSDSPSPPSTDVRIKPVIDAGHQEAHVDGSVALIIRAELGEAVSLELDEEEIAP